MKKYHTKEARDYNFIFALLHRQRIWD